MRMFVIGLVLVISGCASRPHEETSGFENCMALVYSGLSELTPEDCKKWKG